MSENIDKVIEDLARKEFVVFAGAGVVGETGISPSWKRLLEKFKEDEPDSVDENLDEIDENEYPRLAQRIFERLRIANKENRYYEMLRDGLRATNANYSAQEIDIVETSKHVLTTNFEGTFESALTRVLEGKQNCTRAIQSLPELKYDALSKEYSVSYLHGRVDERCVVFKEDDYKAFYPSQFGNQTGTDNLEILLRNIYGERTIVFVGFGFNDIYLLGALQKIRMDLERNDAEGKRQKESYRPLIGNIQHYACLPEFCIEREKAIFTEKNKGRDGMENYLAKKQKQNDERNNILAEVGIKVLRYKQHKDWMDWFTRIRENRRGIKNANFSQGMGSQGSRI